MSDSSQNDNTDLSKLNFDYNLPYHYCPYRCCWNCCYVPCCCCCCCCPHECILCPNYSSLCRNYDNLTPKEEENNEEQTNEKNAKDINTHNLPDSNINSDENANQNIEQKKNGKDLFNEYLAKVMNIEDDIEEAKKKVAINPDFNCEDTFRLFDLIGSNDLSPSDIKRGFRKLNIIDTGNDLNLFMNRNGLTKKDSINYEEFCDVVTPFEKTFRDDVFNREPNDLYSTFSLLSEGSKNSLHNLFNLIINTERNLNEMKKEIDSAGLDLQELFPCIKEGKNITHDDFIDYLQNNGLLKDMKGAELLYIRLDKNRDGEIQPEELKDEITPLL